jgi:anti-sigma B factor antagonist
MQTFKLDLDKLPISDDTFSVYQPKGKLSLETVSETMQKLRADVVPHMILDMSCVSYLDSAGVGSLVSLFVHRRSGGKKFALAALTPQSNATVKVAGLQNLLPLFATVEEALAKKT